MDLAALQIEGREDIGNYDHLRGSSNFISCIYNTLKEQVLYSGQKNWQTYLSTTRKDCVTPSECPKRTEGIAAA